MSKEFLKVALIQSTLDKDLAWNTSTVYRPRMDNVEAKRIWNETSRVIADYDALPIVQRPEIILMPEFAVADIHKTDLDTWARQLGCIIIAGHDFEVVNGQVENRASVVIPHQWPHGKGKAIGKTFHFGKRFPAYSEKQYIKNCGYEYSSAERFYILDTGEYGRIGLAICADFYDIERFALYKGRVQHIFIIAYNKDVKSFYFLAEAISRLVYCNVIICNTGFYGGSICFSLYKDDYRRYLYKHEGNKLFTSQIVSLPVESLIKAQQLDTGNTEFKSQPPSYINNQTKK